MNDRARAQHPNFKQALAVAATTLLISSGLVGLTLTVLILRANPHTGGLLHGVGTMLSMLWLAAALNAVFVLPLLLALPLIGLTRSRLMVRGVRAYFGFGLLALNIAWILWNHLQMAHQPLSVRPFITATGLLEVAGISAIVLLIGFAGCMRLAPELAAPERDTPRRVLMVALAVMIAGGLLVLDHYEASQTRLYSGSEIRMAARKSLRATPPLHSTPPSASSPKALLIGIDGLSWSSLQPLLDLGRLPWFARLIEGGRVGYLSNGDLSFSPPIWSTIFTGRSEREHGIHGFQQFKITLSGQTLSKLGTLGDSFNAFYGMNFLLGRIPSPGLWVSKSVGARDRTAPPVWDIASHYGSKVVTVNPITSAPFSPVNGAILDLGKSWTSGARAFQPVSLAEKWGKEAAKFHTLDDDASYQSAATRVKQEVDFSINLIRELSPDLAIFYTHFVDSVHHFNWDFHSRDAFYLDDLPSALSNDEWNEFLADHVEDRVFQSVILMDAEIGRFMHAFPDATLIVISDHGWTYSGYEHFGSQDGVIIVSGPSVSSRAEISDAHIGSITPTLLALLGVPLSREFLRPPCRG